jgi:hypothetical protein
MTKFINLEHFFNKLYVISIKDKYNLTIFLSILIFNFSPRKK